MIVNKLIRDIKKMRLKDWRYLFRLLITFIPGKIYKMIHSNVWVISEYEMTARDNGYWFYKYIRESHPDIISYYPISEKSPDYVKIKELGNCVKHGGLKHCMLFWAAKIYCSSGATQGFPSPHICHHFVLYNMHAFKYIFLNHGITRGFSTIVNRDQTNYDLLCTCSDLDKKIIIKDNMQSEDVVKVTGFARHDNLDDSILDKKMIVIMPTWREWLSYRYETTDEGRTSKVKAFLESDYFSKYNELLNSNAFISFLEENNLSCVFYLHQYAQVYVDFFTTKTNRIKIGTYETHDVQNLLKKAAVLITDYSSVCYDFAYMLKPVIYYQFDLELFESKQYASGTSFSYEKQGMGDICKQLPELLSLLCELKENDFEISDKYRDRVNDFFTFHDKNNCKRIYDEIIRLDYRKRQ